ncbi:hypothetical protein D3C86_1867210 [compost metagenome]
MDMLLEYELVEEQGVLLLKRTRGDFVPAIKFIDLPASDDEEKNAFWLLIALLILVPMTSASSAASTHNKRPSWSTRCGRW